jgi:imidazole glycerol-phosphate synthase subunit HisH
VIALIDYRAGNLTSVKKALATLGAEVIVPETPEEIADAAGVIVPGVGHFGATRALDARWVEAILGRVGEGRPLLGICLGMQWLFEGSEEAPDLPGLGLLAGRCYRLGSTVRPEPDAGDVIGREPDTTDDRRGGVRPRADRNATIKVPHVGWNSLAIERSEASIVEGVDSGAQVYFTHSYVAPVTGDSVAITEHGEPFAAVVQRGYIAGVQFHPEKSGDVGLRILRNFVELAG